MNFFDKLTHAIARNQSLLIVGLDPNPEFRIHQSSQAPSIAQLKQWLLSIITQTADLVCAYKPTLGFYEALGVEGLALLLEIIKAIPADIPLILDAKHGDLNTSTVFARTIFEQWQVDAVTLNAYAGQDQAAPFLLYPDKGTFILAHTSNPSAVALQEYPTEQTPFYLQMVREAKTWGTLEQVGLEVGTTDAKVLQNIRAIAPERFILLRNIWSEKVNIESIISAGLNSNGEGLLIPVSQDSLNQDNLTENLHSLREEINQIRERSIKEVSQCELWMPDVCFLKQHPHQDLILQLYEIGCLLFGNYVQASGATFSYYIDLRQIISTPQLFHQILKAYSEVLQPLTFDRIAGIPYGSLPTATGLSLRLDHPMIYPRKEVKAHGTRRLIEGTFNPGEKVVVVDDILITGKSVIEGAEKLRSSGLIVEDIVVFIDHEECVKDKLKSQGYQAYSVLTISEITETLYEAGKISEEQYQSLQKT